NESGNESSKSHRPVAAGGVLRIPFLLWAGGLRPARRRRTTLCASGARNARTLRLGYSHAARQTLAGKASAVLLAGHAVVSCGRRERPDCAGARCLRRGSADCRHLLLSAPLSAGQ